VNIKIYLDNLRRSIKMNTIKRLITSYTTPKNRKALFIILTLIGLAAAGGAPGASSGIGGGIDVNSFFAGF
jgi:hypothetical protein